MSSVHEPELLYKERTELLQEPLQREEEHLSEHLEAFSQREEQRESEKKEGLRQIRVLEPSVVKMGGQEGIPVLSDKVKEEKAVIDHFFAMAKMVKEGNGAGDSVWNRLHEKTEGSASYKQFRDAVEAMATLYDEYRETQEKADVAELLDAMSRLQETANSYLDLHSGHRFREKGQSRKETAQWARQITAGFFMKLDRDAGTDRRDPLAERLDAQMPHWNSMVKKLEGARVEKRLKELLSHYPKLRNEFSSLEGCERENIRVKAGILEAYKEEFEIYIRLHISAPVPREMQKLLDHYREYKVANRVLSHYERDHALKSDVVSKVSREYFDTMDYRQKPEEDLKRKDVDQGLTWHQIKAVKDIDRWFTRNYFNGGMVGSVIHLHNHHAETVGRLLGMSMRERLFIYYLIETGKRKSPELSDAFASQSDYIPDLSKFKKQMLTTRLKATAHVMGGYTLMYKLSEAMEVNRSYQEVIRDCSGIVLKEEERDRTSLSDRIREEEKSWEPAEDAAKEEEAKRSLSLQVENRFTKLREAYRTANDLKRLMKTVDETKDKGKKAALEGELSVLRERASSALSGLIEADQAVEEAYEYHLNFSGEVEPDRLLNREDNNKKDFADYAKTYASGGSALAKKADTGLGMFGKAVKWDLKGSALADTKIYGAAVSGGTISGIGSLMTVFMGLYTLKYNWDQQNIGDNVRDILNIAKSLTAIGTDIRAAYETGKTFSEAGAEAAKDTKVVASKGLTIAKSVSAAYEIGAGMYQVTTSILDSRNADNAKKYLEKKRQQAKALQEKKEEERSAEEEQKIKEARYEELSIKLADSLADRKGAGGIMKMFTGYVSLATVLLPGLGIALTAGGLGVTLATAIVDAVKMSGVRQELFDSYFKFGNYIERMKSELQKTGRNVYNEKNYRKRMRRVLAASGGYCDMGNAADQIAKRLSDQITGKLFGPEPLQEDEKAGYVEMVKMFGLTYNEKKRKPTARMLAKKMTGR